MTHKERSISIEEFLNRDFIAHSFYEILPSSNITICVDRAFDLEKLVESALAENLENVSQRTLDHINALLVNGEGDRLSRQILAEMAEKFSLWYSQLLKGKKSNRPLRMRLQLLNFCLRDILDAHLVSEACEEQALLDRSPWDFVEASFGRVFITSNEKNVTIESVDRTRFITCGLPSQIDPINSRELSVGSIFSEGGWILEDGSHQKYSHELPIVLFLDVQARLFLDYRGGLYELGSRTKLDQLDVEEVSKARRVGQFIYIFDWTRPYELYRYSLTELVGEWLNIAPIIIGNDITNIDEYWYLIDKQQGSIFKFDEHFCFIERKLGFGIGEGRLFDPISVRASKSKDLSILNWVSSKIVTIPKF